MSLSVFPLKSSLTKLSRETDEEGEDIHIPFEFMLLLSQSSHETLYTLV